LNGSQVNVPPELRNLRVAPWHQLLGAGPLNMHGVMGELLLSTRDQGLQITALTAAVAALSANEDLSAEEMTAVINAAIANAVIDVDVTVKDETNEPPA
ncbi:MAG: hypothetical protein ACREOB_04150, partial [Thermodesulfobacteriota bacterium]